MKKRTLSFLLALVMCLSLLPMTALAAGPTATAQGVTLSIDKDNYVAGETITFSWSGMSDARPSGVLWGYYLITEAGSDHIYEKDIRYTIPGKEEGEHTRSAPTEDGVYELRFYWGDTVWWDCGDGFITSVTFTVGNVKTGSISVPQTEHTAYTRIDVDYSGITEEMANANAFVGIFRPGDEHDFNKIVNHGGYGHVKAGAGQVTLTTPNINGQFELRLYNTQNYLTEDNLVMSVPITLSGATASEWAVAELAKADELGLIPEILDGADLTADITRAEFAAVAVKAYEALANGEAIPAVNNPFTDTSDVEVLKAYNIGAVNGTSATTFDPNALLNREQAAAMLTRVFKKVSLAGWTLATDSQFTLPYEKPALFADDADISDWAKDSVYFMVANGIINGVGDNKFAPKNVTSADEANGYANATREQALIIAVRMVENLK